ncbi:C-type lectin-like protein [Fowlpox virus]|nr:C-type lectin-like protein [Fowlpox virus]
MIIKSGNINKESEDNEETNKCVMEIPIILVVSISVSMIVIVPIILLNPKYRCNEFVKYRCQYGWKRNNDLCYYTSKTESSWDKSIIECNLLGGDLITVTEDNKNYLKTNITTKNGYWIGLKRTDGEFKWIDNKNATNILPDNVYKTHNCGYINRLDIKAANCKKKKKYICVKYLEIIAY